jgi:hypothetical protein
LKMPADVGTREARRMNFTRLSFNSVCPANRSVGVLDSRYLPREAAVIDGEGVGSGWCRYVVDWPDTDTGAGG